MQGVGKENITRSMVNNSVARGAVCARFYHFCHISNSPLRSIWYAAQCSCLIHRDEIEVAKWNALSGDTRALGMTVSRWIRDTRVKTAEFCVLITAFVLVVHFLLIFITFLYFHFEFEKKLISKPWQLTTVVEKRVSLCHLYFASENETRVFYTALSCLYAN